MPELVTSSAGNTLIPANPEPGYTYPQIPKHNNRYVELNPLLTEETRTIELSVSSDKPYFRWFGYEELDHSEAAVDLTRFNDGAQVLFNHNRDDYIGIIQKAWLDGGKLYNKILFDTHELAEKIYQSISSGIVRNVSIGYEINEMKVTGQRDGVDVYRATRWTPFETSIVTVPADASVGVGRSYLVNLGETLDSNVSEEKDMSETGESTLQVNEKDIRAEERNRVRGINALISKYGHTELGERAIDEGMTVQEARSLYLDKVTTREVQSPIAATASPLGMSQKEQQRYSFSNAIRAALNGGIFSENCFEKEIHDELVSREKKSGIYKERNTVKFPARDLRVDNQQAQLVRNQQVADPLLGGNLVETELREQDFITLFRNSSIMNKMGMRYISDLTGNLDLPKHTKGVTDGSSIYWVAEDTDVGKIQSDFGLVKFRPKIAGSYMYATRSMLLQSSIAMDNFMRQELAIALALGMDWAAIQGSGLNEEPLGLLNTPGVNNIIFGADGGEVTHPLMVAFETAIATANADERTMGWVMNPKLRGELKSREKFAGTSGNTHWENGMTGSNVGYVNGYRVGVSNQIPGNLTKGAGTNLSAAIFGDFSRLVCAEWGSYDLAADPYDRFLAGGVRVRIIHMCDINVTQEKAFSVATDIQTPYSEAIV